MSTAAQATANLANSQFSTGPRTAEGRAAASHNALKHGLTAQTILMPGEDPAAYEALRLGMISDFEPVNTIESAMVQELTDAQWRLNRVARIEAKILSAESPDFKALNNVSLHASRLKRQFSATLKELTAMRLEYTERYRHNLENAALLREADLLKNKTTDLAKFGFVFTLQQVDDSIEYLKAIESARATVRVPRKFR